VSILSFLLNEENENKQSVTCPLKLPLQYQKNVKFSMSYQNVFGRGKLEKLNDNAVKTEDYVIRMTQICLWGKYSLSFHFQF